MKAYVASLIMLLGFTALYEVLISFRYISFTYQLCLIPLVAGLITELVIIFTLFIWRYLIRTPLIVLIGVITYLLGFLLSNYLGYEFALIAIIVATLLVSPILTVLSKNVLNVVEVISLSATLAALVAFILMSLVQYLPYLNRYLLEYLKLLPWYCITECALGLLMIIYGVSLIGGGGRE